MHERDDYRSFACGQWRPMRPEQGWAIVELGEPIMHDEMVMMHCEITHDGRLVGYASGIDIAREMLAQQIGSEAAERVVVESGAQ